MHYIKGSKTIKANHKGIDNCVCARLLREHRTP